jgi:hypothetical protein
MTSVVDMRSACRRVPKIAGIENIKIVKFELTTEASLRPWVPKG